MSIANRARTADISRLHRRGQWVFVALLLVTPLALTLSLMTGPYRLDLEAYIRVVPFLLEQQSPSDVVLAGLYTVINDIRIPRTLLAWIVGAALGLSGAVMQGLFRNPLADPSIIGVTSGASLGASIAIVIGAGTTVVGLSGLLLGSFLGGLLAVALVYQLATRSLGGLSASAQPVAVQTSVSTMLLAGIAITALAGAANSAMAYFGDNEMLRRISLWNMGGLDVASHQRVALAALVIFPSLLLMLPFRRRLDALLLGESEARYLGVNVQQMKRWLVVLAALAVASSVALAGVIGFVGLVVPHTLRLLAGPGHHYLLPCSALGGGVLLVLADSLTRVIVAPAEMPVGVITALLGAPLFVVLLLRRNDYGMS